MLKKMLSITMVLMLVLSSVSFAFAENKDNGKENKPEFNTQSIEENDEVELEENDEENELGKGLDKAWKENKEILEAEKDELESAKDLLEEGLEALEEEYEGAIEAGDEELAAQLAAELMDKRAEFNEVKFTFKTKLNEMKVAIRNTYTEEELTEIQKVTEELEEQDMKVLPVENIMSKKGKFKFDVPPVIKDGRTLIPIRAITEGFGAEVVYEEVYKEGSDNELVKIVTITKGNDEIVLELESRVATVNGEEIELDTQAELMNNRTVVPLRFIAENLGLKVKWDGETETIEIDEVTDEEDTEEDTEED